MHITDVYKLGTLITVIKSFKTDDVYKTGQENDVDLFSKKKS